MGELIETFITKNDIFNMNHKSYIIFLQVRSFFPIDVSFCHSYELIYNPFLTKWTFLQFKEIEFTPRNLGVKGKTFSSTLKTLHWRNTPQKDLT